MKKKVEGEKNKYVVWGAGTFGLRANLVLGKKNLAFIDSNPLKIGSEFCGKKIIDLETYLDRYRDCAIVLAMFNFESKKEIEKRLEQNGISEWFTFDDNPSELFRPESSGHIPFEEMLIEKNIHRNDRIAIKGGNLFSKLLYDYMIDNDYDHVSYNATEDCSIVLNTDRKNALNNRMEFGEVPFYSFSYLKRYTNHAIERFHNTVENKKCVIVCTGPSLNISDLDLLQKYNIPSFGMNRTYVAFDKTNWRPWYYVVSDGDVLWENKEDLLGIKEGIKFFSDDLALNGDCKKYIEDHIHERDDIVMLHQIGDGYGEEGPEFAEDLTQGAFYGTSVMYSAFQLACYLGYKEIYIIGADCNTSGDENNMTNDHFVEGYSKNAVKKDVTFEKLFIACRNARNYAEKHGITIYNATRGGKLEEFNRVSFETIFKDDFH